MKHKYGYFNNNQIAETKKYMRKKIFFLLLCVDPDTCDEYKETNLNEAFNNILYEFGGLNEILYSPTELVRIISLLEAAKIELNREGFNTNDFRHSIYRKLILDAGSEVTKIKEV